MSEEKIKLVVTILLIAGSLNWGMIALFGIDVVTSIVGANSVDQIIKLAVGIAGVYSAYQLIKSLSLPAY
jgi:uncharacterized protein